MHIPVLFDEVLELLAPPANGHAPYRRFIDGTLGAGGHCAGILEATAPQGRVLAFDKDAEAIAFAKNKLAEYGNRVIYANHSYAEMGTVAPAHGFEQVDGILLDLGLSSRQLDNGQRGFSFMKEGPLDMRFDTSQGETAADLLNNLDERELVTIIWRYGEERQSRRMAKLIVENRPHHTTTELAALISQNFRRKTRIHPATKLFQALRIAVNQELETVRNGVETAVTLLKPGGRIAVISFHSLEDRIIKNLFRDLSRDCICPPKQPICNCDTQAKLRLITRKVIKATDKEIKTNTRSRSARLRVAEKL